MKKLEMTSANYQKKMMELLKSCFPGVITEVKDKNGTIRKGIHFGLLQKQLSMEATDEPEEYEFNWIGKKAAILESNIPTRKTLRPMMNDSRSWTNTGNLYIEGDNLDVLKLLQKSYAGRIKMIYIDPPYNTGNDFIYRDDYSLNPEDYEKHLAEVSDEIKKNHTHARFHSGWCSMMYPRLKLARNLMKEDGVIFISIDEYELDNLKKICNEIFGENNFITIIGLEITKTQGMKVKAAKEGSIVKNYEYVLCYAKSTVNKRIVKNILFDKNEGYDTHFSYYIEKAEGKYIIRKLVDVLKENDEVYDEFRKYHLIRANGKIGLKSLATAITVSEKVREYVYTSLARNIYQEMACAITVDPETESQLDVGKIIEYKGYLLTKSTGGRLRQYSSLEDTLKMDDEYKSEYGRVTIRGNLWKGFYSDMMNVAKEGDVEYKNGKKPVRLIYQLAKWIGVEGEDTVLDFFSGSATTAQAVMELNARDFAHRKYIMVQLNEDLDEAPKTTTGVNQRVLQKTVEFLDSVNRPHILSELGKQRIINCGQRITGRLQKGNSEKSLADDCPQIDIGFRVFRLDSSNLTEEYFADTSDLSHHEKNCIREDRSDMDLLYGILLDLGMPLTINFQQENISGVTVYTTAVKGNDLMEESDKRSIQQTMFELELEEAGKAGLCAGHDKSIPTLIACFADRISKNNILEMINRQPDYVVVKANSLSLTDKSVVDEYLCQYAPATAVKTI